MINTLAHPIIQAPMAGGATTPELVAAVCNTGGLGSIGAAYLTPEKLRADIQKVKSLTTKPFQVNLFVPEPHRYDELQLQKAKQFLAPFFQPLCVEFPVLSPPFYQDIQKQVAVLLEEKVSIASFVLR